jgi:REP element-mobilizing transposase RayT
MSRSFDLTNYFHVTGKCRFDEWPLLTMDMMWSHMCDHLEDLKEGGFRTHAFVLMNNHFHILCSSDQEDLKSDLDWLNELINVSMVEIACDFGNILEEYDVVPIKSYKQYKETYKYIYRNPIEAGLVRRAEEYEYSSLDTILKSKEERLSFEDNLSLIFDPIGTIKLINHDFVFYNYLFH